MRAIADKLYTDDNYHKGVTVIMRRRKRTIANIYLYCVGSLDSRVKINIMWRQYGWEIVLTREKFNMLEQSMRGIMRNMRMMEKKW